MNKTLKKAIIVLLSAIMGILFVFAVSFLFSRQERFPVRAEVVVKCASLKDKPYIVGELLTMHILQRLRLEQTHSPDAETKSIPQKGTICP